MPLFTVTVEHHHYFHPDANQAAGHAAILAAIQSTKESIMSAQTEAADQLNAQSDKLDAANAQLSKIATEVQGLKDALASAGSNVDPVLAAAISRVVGAVGTTATAVQVVDDLNPDATA